MNGLVLKISSSSYEMAWNWTFYSLKIINEPVYYIDNSRY